MMQHCPVCERRAIPASYVFTPPLLQKPIRCNSCGATLEQVHGWRDYVPQLPLIATMIAVYHIDAPPEWLVWFVLGLGALLGVSLWALTIRFRQVPDAAEAAVRRPI